MSEPCKQCFRLQCKIIELERDVNYLMNRNKSLRKFKHDVAKLVEKHLTDCTQKGNN